MSQGLVGVELDHQGHDLQAAYRTSRLCGRIQTLVLCSHRTSLDIPADVGRSISGILPVASLEKEQEFSKLHGPPEDAPDLTLHRQDDTSYYHEGTVHCAEDF